MILYIFGKIMKWWTKWKKLAFLDWNTFCYVKKNEKKSHLKKTVFFYVYYKSLETSAIWIKDKGWRTSKRQVLHVSRGVKVLIFLCPRRVECSLIPNTNLCFTKFVYILRLYPLLSKMHYVHVWPFVLTVLKDSYSFLS